MGIGFFCRERFNFARKRENAGVFFFVFFGVFVLFGGCFCASFFLSPFSARERDFYIFVGGGMSKTGNSRSAHRALRRIASLAFLFDFWAPAGACQRHGVGGFLLRKNNTK